MCIPLAVYQLPMRPDLLVGIGGGAGLNIVISLGCDCLGWILRHQVSFLPSSLVLVCLHLNSQFWHMVDTQCLFIIIITIMVYGIKYRFFFFFLSFDEKPLFWIKEMIFLPYNLWIFWWRPLLLLFYSIGCLRKCKEVCWSFWWTFAVKF